MRRAQDRDLIGRMVERLLVLFPRCTRAEAQAIAEHTAARGSGRVGRSAAGRDLEEGALTAAVAAAIRHNHTDYDALLAAGLDRALARGRVADRVSAILTKVETVNVQSFGQMGAHFRLVLIFAPA